MHTHGTMGSSPEVLSWTSCPSLLVGKLKEELKLSVVGDAMKKAGSNPSPQQHPPPPSPPPIIADLAPPPASPTPAPARRPPPTPGQDEETAPAAALSEDSSREQRHFENSVLQLQEQEDAESPGSGGGGCGSGGEDGRGGGGEGGGGGDGGGQPVGHPDAQVHGHPHDDIKLRFHRAGNGTTGFLEGLFGCLRPVWNIIGKSYSTDYKLQQQGAHTPLIRLYHTQGLPL